MDFAKDMFGMVMEMFNEGWFGKLLGTFMVLLFIGTICLLLFLAFIIADYASGTTRTINVEIIDRSYTPSRVGIGSGAASNGGSAIVTTYTPEEYTVIYRYEGEIHTGSFSSEFWAECEKGQRRNITVRFGGISEQIL